MSDEKKEKKLVDGCVCGECVEGEPQVVVLDGGLMISNPEIREAVKWISMYPLMAILRKDGQPVPTLDRADMLDDANKLGLRDRVGIMILCAVTLRILGQEQRTLEGFKLSQDISQMFATVAATTGLPLPSGPWSVMQYAEMLNRLN